MRTKADVGMLWGPERRHVGSPEKAKMFTFFRASRWSQPADPSLEVQSPEPHSSECLWFSLNWLGR